MLVGGDQMRRLGLLGAGLLGQGIAAGNRHIGPPYFLLNDTFATDRAAGAVNGTPAEPGPGLRTVADTNSKLSLVGGQASFATGGANNGNPRVTYGPIAREPGRLLISQQQGSSGASTWVGWHQTAGNFPQQASLRYSPTTTLIFYDGGTLVTVAAYVVGTTYQVAIPLRSAGSFCFVKGGIYTNWTLIHIGAGNSSALMYPNLSGSASGVMTVDEIRVPATKWLPTPLASDGFAEWGTTDGLGHTEGVAGGIGSGGAGLAWTEDSGTWTAAGGVAYSEDGLGVDSIAFVDTGVADVIATANITLATGIGGVVVRYADGANYVKGIHNKTNAQLIKVVNGTPTTLINIAATYGANVPIRVICEGQKFRLFYNNVAIGAEQTIADAALADGTGQGVILLDDAGHTADNFVVYAKGSAGEYADLDDL